MAEWTIAVYDGELEAVEVTDDNPDIQDFVQLNGKYPSRLAALARIVQTLDAHKKLTQERLTAARWNLKMEERKKPENAR